MRLTPLRTASLVGLVVAATRSSADTGDTGDTGVEPVVLGASDIGIGTSHKQQWIRQYGTEKHDEAFVVAPSEAGLFVGGITHGSWFRKIHDKCRPNVDDPVPDDCGDAVVFNVATGKGVQQGEALADSVRGLSVANGFVTFAGRTRQTVDGRLAAFATRYTDDLRTLQWDWLLTGGEFLGVTTYDDLTYGVGGAHDAQELGEPDFGHEDAVVVALDANGLATNIEQDGSTEFDEYHDVQADDGAVVIVGLSGGYMGPVGGVDLGEEDAVLLVENHTLEEVDELCRVQFGTKRRDVGEGVALQDKFIYVVGSTEGILNGNLPNPPACFHDNPDSLPDAFLAKFDRDCNPIWARSWGTLLADAAEGVAADDEHIYVSGFSSTGVDHVDEPRHETTDAFLRVYTHDGDVVGEVVFDSSRPAELELHVDFSRGVAVDEDNVYVVGATEGAMGDKPNLGSADIFVATVPKASVIGNVVFDGDGCKL
jgi:hypothetical protein